MLAQRYMAVPSSSVSNEVFSTAGDIVKSGRSVLSTENVDILIFLKKTKNMQ